MSEWGNPPLYEVFKGKKVLLVEFIAFNLGTRGTETSKYPEEYKSIEISSVAVSESETA